MVGLYTVYATTLQQLHIVWPGKHHQDYWISPCWMSKHRYGIENALVLDRCGRETSPFSNPLDDLISWTLPVKLVKSVSATETHSWQVNIGSGVMAWCRQAASHYLSQLSGSKPLPEPIWPKSMSPCGVTRSHCVNWKTIEVELEFLLVYDISHKIYTRFSNVLVCCGYIVVISCTP